MSIKINLKIFAFAVIFYFTKQIKIYAIFMLFALIHEMGHLLAGLILGLKPKCLKIMPLGVCIEFYVQADDYNKKVKKGNILALKKIFIVLAGPITNFIIATICYISKISILDFSAEQIIYANILIGTFNLIPIYPLDGGRLIKNIIHITKGRKTAIQYANKISNISILVITAISSIAIYYYKNIAILLILIYLWILVISENKKYNTKIKIYKIINKTKGNIEINSN